MGLIRDIALAERDLEATLARRQELDTQAAKARNELELLLERAGKELDSGFYGVSLSDWTVVVYEVVDGEVIRLDVSEG